MAVASSSDVPDQQKQETKRTTNPGMRVVHGRIYDSENGKTCHQCRQKTRDFSASCKNQKNSKPCPLAFCHSCLLNRYGEKAEEVNNLEDWDCPKCRGICNCSFCRKKRGQQPTGVLLHRAKATGYSSVSELLHVNGPENFGHVRNSKEIIASPRKINASGKDTLIAYPKKQGKENSCDGVIAINLDPLPTNPLEKQSKRIKQEGLPKIRDGSLEDDSLSNFTPCLEEKSKEVKQGTLQKTEAGQNDGAVSLKVNIPLDKKIEKKMKREELNKLHDHDNGDAALLDSIPKRFRTSDESNIENPKIGKVNAIHEDKEGSKTRVLTSIPADPFRNKKENAHSDKKTHNDADALRNKKNGNDEAQGRVVTKSHKDNWKGLHFQSRYCDTDILVPDATELTTLVGIELPQKDVGNALQFLEFCAAFGKILNLKKGQSTIILQELINGRGRLLRREQYSAVVHFHIQLLTILQKESGSGSKTLSSSHGKNSWLSALQDYISEFHNSLNWLPLNTVHLQAGGYDALDSSTKLRLLNYLCDEVLETEKIRSWIDDQNLKSAKRAKQARERVLAAKEKEKRLKQKMVDEVAKAILAKNGDPLSILEHDEIVRKIKFEAAQAHAEMLESMGMAPKNKQRLDAVRSEPILLDVDGCAYWRLNGYPDKPILVQEIGSGDDSVALGERWLAFDDEQEKVVKERISCRERMLKAQRITETFRTRSTDAIV